MTTAWWIYLIVICFLLGVKYGSDRGARERRSLKLAAEHWHFLAIERRLALDKIRRQALDVKAIYDEWKDE